MEESELDTDSLSSAAEELCDLEETSSHSWAYVSQPRDVNILLLPLAPMLQHYTEQRLVAAARGTQIRQDCHFAVVSVGK